MSKTPEGRVKDAVKKLLDHRLIWYYMPVQTGYGVRGVPDFICCVNGRFLAIETKAKASNHPTPLQVRAIEGIQGANGIALVIHADNMDVLNNTLNDLLEVENE